MGHVGATSFPVRFDFSPRTQLLVSACRSSCRSPRHGLPRICALLFSWLGNSLLSSDVWKSCCPRYCFCTHCFAIGLHRLPITARSCWLQAQSGHACSLSDVVIVTTEVALFWCPLSMLKVLWNKECENTDDDNIYYYCPLTYVTESD